MFVKPAPDMQIVDPHRRDRLKQNEWRWVGGEMRSYWARLVRDGDVVLSQTRPVLTGRDTIEGEVAATKKD
jgi:hypothetical protein